VDVQKILVPIDYSADSQQALQWGTSLAGKYGAQLTLLHVIPRAVEEVSPPGSGFLSPTSSFSEGMAIGRQPPDRQRIIIDLVDQAQTALHDYAVKYLATPLPLQVKIAVGKPAEEILRVAREERVGLIIMGTHGHTGLRHLLVGSVAEAVAHQAHCPVFTVRSDLKAVP
jgi:nucleotide-binding universal stress UspA family protein